jgi:transmembrane sensor
MSDRSPSEFSPDREPTAQEQRALAWVVDCDRGLEPAQERELAAWLDAEPRHRALFEEFGGTWTLLGRGREAPRAAVAVPGGVLVPFEAQRPKSAARHRARVAGLSLAAAAAVALAYVGAARREQHAAAIATDVGASRVLTLPDRSAVQLNTDSVLVTAFTATERRVRLTQGEAYFKIAKDRARPFIVEAAGVAVRAVGTEFNVRMRADSVEVLVTEGKVRVGSETPPAKPMLAPPRGAASSPSLAAESGAAAAAGHTDVSAGERVVVSVAVHPSDAPPPPLTVGRVPADEARRVLAWQQRRLDFSETTLGEMVAEFNRYNRHKLAVPEAELAALRFGGSFRPDDRVGFVRMLRENFGITAEEGDNLTILRTAR